jgi:hypothetical protein
MIDTLPHEEKDYLSHGFLRAAGASCIVAAVLVAVWTEKPDDAARRADKAPASVDFSDDWKRETHVDLEKTLRAAQVEHCAVMAYRPHRRYPGEYLVYCSDDGRGWTAWSASTGSQRVRGPYAPDPLIANPS